MSKTQITSNKKLFEFICDQMVKLDNLETSPAEAAAMAMLAKQANMCLKHELEKVELQIKLTDLTDNKSLTPLPLNIS